MTPADNPLEAAIRAALAFGILVSTVLLGG
jgi:hypothetical protein